MIRLRRLQPYGYQLFMLAYTPVGLYADSRVANVWQQAFLGLITFGVLVLATRLASPMQRRQVWLAIISRSSPRAVTSTSLAPCNC